MKHKFTIEYEGVNGKREFAHTDVRLVNGDNIEHMIVVPKGATNGDMIKALFNIPDSGIGEGLSTTYIYTNTRVLKGDSQDFLRKQITFDRDWWNAPYKKEVEE